MPVLEVFLSCSFLGGGPVEIGSGVAGLAYSWVLGRRNERELLNFRPHNVSLVGLGSELRSTVFCFFSLPPFSLHSLVRMARFQRRERFRSESPSDICNLEYHVGCCFRWDGLVPS